MGNRKYVTTGTIDDLEVGQLSEQILADMKDGGTYKKGCEYAVRRYAQLRIRRERIFAEFCKKKSPEIETHTNKAGAANLQQSTISKIIKQMDDDLGLIESRLGILHPGIQKIKLESKDNKKKSQFVEALNKLDKDLKGSGRSKRGS